MKKLLLIAAFVGCSLASMAQVDLFKGSLKEAIEKAKNENKTVMIMASTTWCGPCKGIEANVLPTKEATDYFNPNYVFIKYHLDKADPDKVAETYGIRAYPTFIFINGDGEEVIRTLGGAKDAQSFIDRIKEVTKPENSFKARYEKFKNDPSYAMTYIQFLDNDCYMSKEADALLDELLKTRSIKENFTAENLEFYNKKINSTDSPVLKTMISNEKEIQTLIGKDVYTKFMQEKGSSLIMGQIFSRKFDAANFDKVIAAIKATKPLQSNFSKFVEANKQIISNKDYKALIPITTKALAKSDAKTRDQIIQLTTIMIPKSEGELSKQTALSLYESALKFEKDPEAKKRYEQRIDGIKNPKGIPAMRMM